MPMRNRIERHGDEITLKPRSMAVLVHLAHACGDVVTKQELMQAVWGDSVVTEDVLTQSVVELRKAFGDHARQPEVIETIRRVGFRLIPKVLPAEIQSDTSVVDTESTTALQGSRQPTRRLWWAAFLAAVIAAGYWLHWSNKVETPQTVPDRSVAVLPFINLSNDPENEYFSFGLSEELLHSLAQIPGLKVPARTSSFVFAAQNLDVRSIGARLGVARVVEGSVRRSGKRIRVTAQLVDVSSGYHLWSHTYEREFEDIFVIQKEIAAAIVAALRLNLDFEGDRTYAYPGTASVDSYDLYLLGRFHFRQNQIARARQLFERSIAADPKNARAYAGLADTYLQFKDKPGSFWQLDSPSYSESIGKARAAIDQALALDSQLVDAYLARASLMAISLEFAKVEKDLHRAIGLDPNSARAHAMLGVNQAGQLRFGEALDSYKRALALDPFNPQINADISRLIAQSGRYGVANSYLLRMLESGLQSPLIYGTLKSNADDFGRYEESINWARHLVQLLPSRANALAELGDAYTRIGELELAERWIREAEKLSFLQAFKARSRLLWVKQQDTKLLRLIERALARDPHVDGQPMTPPQSAVVPIAAIVSLQMGEYRKSAEYMSFTLSTSPTLVRRGPHMRMYGLAVLARAYRASGEEGNAKAAIEKALQIGETCRQQGLRGYPQLSRQMAVHHALRGDREKALLHLTRAVDEGWREWYPEGRQPGSDPMWQSFIDTEGYRALMDRVVADLALIRRRVRQNGWDQGPDTFFQNAGPLVKDDGY